MREVGSRNSRYFFNVLLKLLSSLVVLVEGEVARQGLARKQQPFWRRLASIAHASLIEREMTAAKLEFAGISEWALKSGGALYYLQTLVDARQEPRWFPDSVSPQQLKAEFVSRIANAGERWRNNVRQCLRDEPFELDELFEVRSSAARLRG